MNSLQQNSILQIWTAIHSKTELARAVNNLSTTERKFFSEALNFQNRTSSLSGKNFQKLVLHLNGNLSLPARIQRSVRLFFRGKNNTKSILQSRAIFLKNGGKTLGNINSILSNRITGLASKELTPGKQRKIASLELSKDLVGQALIFSTSPSTGDRINQLKHELQNPNLTQVQRNRKEIALAGLKEKHSEDSFASMQRGTNTLLKDTALDLMINDALINLAKKPKATLNPESMQNFLNSGDDLVVTKVKKLQKQYRITNALQTGSAVDEKDKVFEVTSKNLPVLLVEKEALLTKAATYETFLQVLPTASPAA